MTSRFDRSLKRVRDRNWSAIKDAWGHTIRDYEDIGNPPPTGVLETLEFHGSLLPTTGTEKEGHFEVPLVEQLVLREGIFLLHKAAALLRSACRDLNARQCTYAEVTTYTASVYSAKAICALLGVWFSPRKVSNENWIVDCFAPGRKHSFYANAIRAQTERIGHREVWLILQRLLRKSEQLPIDPPLLDLIDRSDPSLFAYHRNQIQYFNVQWYYDDLHGDDSSDVHWISTYDRYIYSDLDPEDEGTHFSVIFFLMLLRAAYRLLQDISIMSTSLENELRLLDRNICGCDSTLHVNSWLRTEYG